MAALLVALLILSASATIVEAQQPSILWQRFGLNPEETHLAVSAGTGAIMSLGASEAQTWPLTLGSWPTRMSQGDAWGVTICAPFIPAGDSELMMIANDTLKAWNPISNRVRSIYQLGKANVSYLETSRDGSKVAIIAWYGDTGTLQLIDRTNGSLIWSLPNAGSIARLSPDGKLLLCALNGGLDLISVASHSILHRYSQFSEFPSGLAWSPSTPGQFAVSGNFSGLMDTSGTETVSLPLGQSIEFSPDGNFVSSDLLIIYRVPDGTPIPLANPATSDAIAFLNNDTLLNLSSGDLSLFEVSSGKKLNTLSCSFSNFISFSGDGSRMLSGAGLTDAETGVGNDSLNSGLISENGKIIVDISGDGSIGLWTESSGAYTIRNSITDTVNTACEAISPNDTDFATAVDIWQSQDDPRNAVQLWSVNSRSLVRTFGSLRPVTALAFSHDGSMLAEINDQDIIVWRVSDGVELFSIPATGTSVAFLPGDSALFIADEGKVDVYSFISKTLISHQNSSINANHFALLPDGKTCVGIHRVTQDNMFEPDSGVQYIDINSGNVIRSFQTPDSGLVNCVAANPVTGDIAVGGQDLIVYKAFGIDAVNQSPSPASQPLHAFASNSRITVDGPAGAERGKIFVYRSDGRCYFMAEVSAGEQSVTTSALPMGDYFIVFQTASGEKYFTKVSLF